VPGARRLGASFAASVLLHAFVFAVVLRTAVKPFTPPLVVIPVSLIGAPGGGGGAVGPSPERVAAPAPEPTAPPPVPTPRREPRVARTKHPPHLTTAPPEAPSGPAIAAVPPETSGEGGAGGGGASGGGEAGGGDGSGGDGSGGARVAYGANPLPPYPLVARRLGKEGLVLLDVLVAPDGHAAEVHVIRSSGFAPLDESAATTVRERWRFIPARRGGEGVAARVTVPIRFRLDDSRG
jgi:periplasmic protein TonB